MKLRKTTGFVSPQQAVRWGIPLAEDGITASVARFLPGLDDAPEDVPLRRVLERMLADLPMRIASKKDVVRLAKTAEARGYNRQLPEELPELAPGGKNLIVPQLFHYHAGGKRVPVHVRCNTYLVFVGDEGKDLREPDRQRVCDFDVSEVFSLPFSVHGDNAWYAEVDARFAAEVRYLTSGEMAEDDVEYEPMAVPESKVADVLKELERWGPKAELSDRGLGALDRPGELPINQIFATNVTVEPGAPDEGSEPVGLKALNDAMEVMNTVEPITAEEAQRRLDRRKEGR